MASCLPRKELCISWPEIEDIQRTGVAGSSFVHSVIFKMAARFYNELNNLSTADFYDIKTKKKGKYYQVEKVISRRTRKRKVS